MVDGERRLEVNMADAILMAGGGGVTSDDVTATTNLVVQGYTTITADSNDEVINGTLPDMPSQTNPLSWRFDSGKAYVKIQKGAYIQENTPSGGAEIVIPFEWIQAHIPSQSVLNNAVIFGKRGEIEDKGDGNVPASNIGTNGGDSMFANFPNGYYHNASGRPYMWLPWDKLRGVLGLDASKMLDTLSVCGVQGQIPRWTSSTGGVISAWNGEGHAWDDTIAGRGRGIISRIPDGYKIEVIRA